MYIFSQANKTKGKSYKVPLSTFYVEEISSHVPPVDAVSVWSDFNKVEVKTCSTLPTGNNQHIFLLDCLLLNLFLNKSLIIFLKDDEHTPAIFCRYPFLFTLECKMVVFNVFSYITKV